MGRELGFKSIVVTVDAAGTAKPATSAPTFSGSPITSLIEIHTPTGNSGNVFWGNSTIDSTGIPRSSDSTVSYSLGEPNSALGDSLDLSKLYFDAATSGDTVIISYLGV